MGGILSQYITSRCTLQISHNFICQFHLSKAEKQNKTNEQFSPNLKKLKNMSINNLNIAELRHLSVFESPQNITKSKCIEIVNLL